jgi:hypothetical protein
LEIIMEWGNMGESDVVSSLFFNWLGLAA